MSADGLSISSLFFYRDMEENNCGTHSKITPLREFQVQIFIHYTAIFVMNERGMSKIINCIFLVMYA